MPRKKIAPLFRGTNSATPPTGDLSTAQTFGPLAVSGHYLYWSRAFSLHYTPLEDLAWTYLRGECGSASICCGRAEFSDHYLVLWDWAGNHVKIRMEHRQTARAFLEYLEGAFPGVSVGYSPEREKRFAVS